MAEEKTNSMDHERKLSKLQQPGWDRDGDGDGDGAGDVVKPHKHSDAHHAESKRRSPMAGDEYSTRRETVSRDGWLVGDFKAESGETEAFSSSSFSSSEEEDCGRERLKRHRIEVAGSVWIPDIWGQEELMKDWIDCSVFDTSLVSSRIMSARAALVAEGRRHTSTELMIENRCKIYT